MFFSIYIVIVFFFTHFDMFCSITSFTIFIFYHFHPSTNTTVFVVVLRLLGPILLFFHRLYLLVKSLSVSLSLFTLYLVLFIQMDFSVDRFDKYKFKHAQQPPLPLTNKRKIVHIIFFNACLVDLKDHDELGTFCACSQQFSLTSLLISMK